eukprot:49189-Chlamydomonas_euryale.AAC.1
MAFAALDVGAYNYADRKQRMCMRDGVHLARVVFSNTDGDPCECQLMERESQSPKRTRGEGVGDVAGALAP